MVLDIETTRAWSSGDRITEIGAVKVRNHQVVDEWHSLVNLQRPIPAKIVELTGITNQVARHAPVFQEAADSFMAFIAEPPMIAADALLTRQGKLARLRSGGNPRALEICSGAGGLSLGLQTAGIELAAHIEIDPEAARSYALNFANVATLRVHGRCRATWNAFRPSSSFPSWACRPPQQNRRRLGRCEAPGDRPGSPDKRLAEF